MARLPDNMKVEKGTNGAFANIQINFTKEEVRDMAEEVLRENDYAPVVHAHWEEAIDTDTQIHMGYRCSNCENRETDFVSPYCRMCGAKMDEEETR